MVVWLRDQAAADPNWTFLPNFVNTLETAMEYIDPDNFDQSPSLPVLIGRPLALVRMAISLETQEPYAVQQSLSAFSQTLRETNQWLPGIDKNGAGTQPQNPALDKTQGFETVRFPVRLGEHHRFQDGVVGYWTEDERGRLSDRFYAPQSDWLDNSDQSSKIRVYRRQDGAMNLWLSLNDAPQTVSLLMDVRGSLHVTSGILPTKELLIPTDQVLPALRAISVTFLTAPLLTGRDQMQISLPKLSGWQWSWIAREAQQWSTLTETPRIDRDQVLKAFPQGGQALWQALLKSGVLTALPGDPVQALYDAKQLNAALDLLFGPASSGNNTASNGISGNGTSGKLAQKKSDHRPFSTDRKDVERFLQIQTRSIQPMQSEATFHPQVLREGWLQLSPMPTLSQTLYNKSDFKAMFPTQGETLWQELVTAQALTPFVPPSDANPPPSPSPSPSPSPLVSPRPIADTAVLNRAKLQDYLTQSAREPTEKGAIAAFFQ